MLRPGFICFSIAALAIGGGSARAIDQTHAAFSRILSAHVSDERVDYSTLKAPPASLDAYLDQLAAMPEPDFAAWPERDRLAFLINLYNAATLRLIVDHYPVKSIRSIGLIPGSAWKREVVRLFGRKVSLDHVEHGIIRKEYPDARAHFALVCAARGCLPLPPAAFVGAKLEAQLDDQGRIFLGLVEKNRVDPVTRTLHLSPIFKWFAGDFEAAAGSILKFVTPYFSATDQTALLAGGFAIAYTDYDWALNDRIRP